MAAPWNTVHLRDWATHRIVEGAPVAVDAAVGAGFPNRRALINANGYTSIHVSARITAAGAASVDLDVLAYDKERDDFAVLGSIAGLADGAVQTVVVNSARVFFRITAQAGDPTVVELRIKAGEPSPRSEA